MMDRDREGSFDRMGGMRGMARSKAQRRKGGMKPLCFERAAQIFARTYKSQAALLVENTEMRGMGLNG
jgi:hypothetical protein